MGKPVNYHNLLYLFLLLISVVSGRKSSAQIIPDNTLPHNSQVQMGCIVCEINGGTVRGTNLFHSFQEFSVIQNGQAIFNNSLGIENIFTRVTGNNISHLDGLIRANGSANLFFINPKGIIFGENASLKIGGSFLASTANSVKFLDGIEFKSQVSENKPLLTITAPIGLQFGNQQNTIQVNTKQGLEIQPNQTLALVGGDIQFNGGIIKTNGGKLELGSVKSADLVNLSWKHPGFLFNYDQINHFGDIDINTKSNLDTSGISGGEIQIQTSNLRMSEASVITSLTLGSLPGGNVIINAADTIEMIGVSDFESKAKSIVDPNTDISLAEDGFLILSVGSGSGGNLEINTNKLILNDSFIILVSTLGVGDGGEINVNASESVEITESLLGTVNRLDSSGNAGNLNINTRKLYIDNRGFIASTSFGIGKAGNININASESIELISGEFFVPDDNDFDALVINTNINSSTLQTADAGNIEINTQKLTVRENTLIAASTLGSGNGGNLTINAGDIQVFGNVTENFGGLATSSEINATGNGGNLIINADNLQLLNQATISVEALGTGNAGNINLWAKSVFMDNFSIISGDTRSNSIDSIQEQANIDLRSQYLIMSNGSRITTNATGNNVIGGNITMNVDFLAALNNSDITANSTDFQGGKVIITAQGIVGTEFRDQLTPESDITATGVSPDFSGNVQIDMLYTERILGLIPLSTGLIDTENQLSQECQSSKKSVNTASKFTVTGRGGLALSPDDLLTATDTIVDLVELVSTPSNHQDIFPVGKSKREPTKIVEAQGWVIDDQGNIHLVAQVINPLPQSPVISKTSCPHP
jgi:filamentous hemagglutinin family protein